MYPEEVDRCYYERWKEQPTSIYSSPAKTRRITLIAHCLERVGPSVLTLSLPEVVDYGCGSGWLLPFLRAYGFASIWAYDVTPKAMSWIQAKYPWVKTVVGDGTFPSPLPTETFNLVFSLEVVEHIPRMLKKEYFRDIYRITAPEGIVILTTPNGLWRKLAVSPDAEQPIEDWITPRELRQYCLDLGFRLIEFGTRGIGQYYRMRDSLLTGKRIQHVLTKLGLWEIYRRCLEKLRLGITIYVMLQKK